MNPRLRVMFLAPALDGGGAERVFSTLLRHLDRSCFELHLAVLQAKGDYIKEIPADVTIHDLQVARARYGLLSIVRVIRDVRPKIVVSTLANMNLTLMSVKPFLPAGTKLLIRESSIASSSLKRERHPAVWEWLYPRLYRRADSIICLSDSMVKNMVECFGLPASKLVRIYNPVDTERVRGAAACENPYSEAGPRLVAVGRLGWEKGFDILIAAMPAILARFPSAYLTILGRGPLAADLAQQATSLGLGDRVRFAGFQQNPWTYIKYADVLVHPSRYEGCPNVLLEALALGTPVVATDCPGATREIQNDYRNMIVAAADDRDALANAMLSVCEGHAARVEPAVNEQNRFDVRQIVEEYARLFLHVAQVAAP
ncbi:MAG TPA: glycosyltransferase [Candidatus Angelobacter sp.]|nr:glycosyltransferase [Candidatus Angelobacter sp.]